MPVSGMAPGRTEAARPNLAAFPADWTEFAPELGRQPGSARPPKQMTC